MSIVCITPSTSRVLNEQPKTGQFLRRKRLKAGKARRPYAMDVRSIDNSPLLHRCCLWHRDGTSRRKELSLLATLMCYSYEYNINVTFARSFGVLQPTTTTTTVVVEKKEKTTSIAYVVYHSITTVLAFAVHDVSDFPHTHPPCTDNTLAPINCKAPL